MTPRDTSFVFIVESPSDEDLLDGRTEGRTLCESLQLSGISGRYSLVTTKTMFYKAMTDRLYEAIHQFPNKVPILHLSMHGRMDGVELTNGDFITWAELQQSLVPLNNAMKAGLIICMSSCDGSAGIRMAMNEDPNKPFWALIGNSASPQWDDAAVAYVTFYHQIFKGQSLEHAVEAMKTASGDENFLYFSGHKVKQDWVSYMNAQRTEEHDNLLSGFAKTHEQKS